MHKVFICYHHANDQVYKDDLIRMNQNYDIFVDRSVNTGDIDESLSDQSIRTKIRDQYLKDSTVSILLVGTETKRRKHVDWELFSSMIDGSVNKKSGILVVNLPTINCDHFTAAHEGEKETIYPEQNDWVSINREEYERRYPYMPARIIDNLVKNDVKISVVSWSRIINNPANLRYLIEVTHRDKSGYEYDLSRPMRRYNS